MLVLHALAVATLPPSQPPPSPPPPIGSSCPGSDDGCPNGTLIAPSGDGDGRRGCIPCPSNFACTAQPESIDLVQLDPGYWRRDLTSLVAYPCEPRDRCFGGGSGNGACTIGANLSGVLCQVCPFDYHYVHGTCMPCGIQREIDIILVSVLSVVLLMAPFFVVRLHSALGDASATSAALAQPTWWQRLWRPWMSVSACSSLPLVLPVVHYLRGHALRRARTVLRGMTAGNKLRMLFAHVQLVSMLPSTFLLNSLHGQPDEISAVFSNAGLVHRAEVNMCLWTSARQHRTYWMLKVRGLSRSPPSMAFHMTFADLYCTLPTALDATIKAAAPAAATATSPHLQGGQGRGCVRRSERAVLP